MVATAIDTKCHAAGRAARAGAADNPPYDAANAAAAWIVATKKQKDAHRNVFFYWFLAPSGQRFML
jgi:hypothetical protein